MVTIRLIHWQEEEASEKARLLREAGFSVSPDPITGSSFLKDLEAENPDAVVIDLSRIPSQGRDMGVAIRRRKGTRRMPIIFVGGDPEKVKKIKNLLPDAVYAAWDDIVPSIKRAIKAGAKDVVVPESAFAAYAGKPLAEKLGKGATSPPRPLPSGEKVPPVAI